MKNIADHLFDIIENSVNANANVVIIKIGYSENLFFCSLLDNGSGISGQEVLDPFVTSRTTRTVGLGLPLLKKAAEDTGGFLKISRLSQTGGTKVEFKIDMSHIDAKPFGDLARTFSDIFFAWPMINFKIFIKKENYEKLIVDNHKLRNDKKLELRDSLKIRRHIYHILQKELRKLKII